MKILMIFNGKNIGGAELQFLELANFLATKHRVTLVSLQGKNAIDHSKISSDVFLKYYAYSSGYTSMIPLLRAIVHCRKFDTDVILTTSFIGNLLGLLVSRGTSQHLFSLQTVSMRQKYSTFDHAILKRFTMLIAGCSDIQVYLSQNGLHADRIRIVNNWVDFSSRVATKDIETIKKEYGLNPSKKIIGCIGRMHHQKGQEFLIRSFKHLALERTDVQLVLVGDGPNMEQMKIEADGQNDIVFTGTVGGENYNNLLAAFDIYVQPSRFEGLPRTLLDAMYMGKPVIATSINGHVDAVDDLNNGLLVAPENENAIYNAVRKLLEDPDLAMRISLRATEDAKRNFTAETQMGKIEHLLY